MPDILFIKTSSLGDVIHHMPAVTEARRRVPGARITWVVEEAYAPVVALHPGVDAIIPVAARRWREAVFSAGTRKEYRAFKHAIRERRYDEIIDTQGLIRSALIMRLAGGRRHGFSKRSVPEPVAAWFYHLRHDVDRGLHAIARNRLLTGRALGYEPDSMLDFGLDRGRLAAAPAGRSAVLLHATARPEKQWPVERWIALGSTLAARGYDLVLPWGTQAERAQSNRIAAVVAGARVPERQPLDQVARLIAGAALVVGVDTGLLHLAAALGVPLVAIFVGSDPALTGPIGAAPIAIVGGKGRMPAFDELLAAVEKVA